MNLSFETIKPNIQKASMQCFEEQKQEPRIYNIIGPYKTGKTTLAKQLLKRLQFDTSQGIVIANQNNWMDYKSFRCLHVENKEHLKHAKEYVEQLPEHGPPNFLLFDLWWYKYDIGNINGINMEHLFMNFRSTNTSVILVFRNAEYDPAYATYFVSPDYSIFCSNQEEDLEQVKEYQTFLPRMEVEEIRKLLDFCTREECTALMINHRMPIPRKFQILSFPEN